MSKTTVNEIDARVKAANTEYRYNRIIEMLGQCSKDSSGKGARVINFIFEFLIRAV